MKKILFAVIASASLMCCTSCGEEEWEKEAMEKRLVGRWECDDMYRRGYLEFYESGEFVKVLYDDDYKEYGENDYRYKDTLHGKWSAHIHVIDKFWFSADYHNQPNDWTKGGTWEIKWKNKNMSFVFDGSQFNKVSGNN